METRFASEIYTILVTLANHFRINAKKIMSFKMKGPNVEYLLTYIVVFHLTNQEKHLEYSFITGLLHF